VNTSLHSLSFQWITLFPDQLATLLKRKEMSSGEPSAPLEDLSPSETPNAPPTLQDSREQSASQDLPVDPEKASQKPNIVS